METISGTPDDVGVVISAMHVQAPRKDNEDAELMALNYVHSIASKLWTEHIPVPSYQDPRHKPVSGSRDKTGNNSARDKSGFNNRDPQKTTNRIRPVQLSTSTQGAANRPGFIPNHFERNQNSREAGVQRIGNWPQAQLSFQPVNLNDKKRAQIKSLPRKPPDIQNVDLFPPISASYQPASSASQNQAIGKGTSAAVAGNNANRSPPVTKDPFSKSAKEHNFDPTFERKKLYNGVQKVQTQICSTASSVPSEAKFDTDPITTAPKTLPIRPPASSSPEKKSRSAELLEELSPDQLQKLNKLVINYSNSLDSNICRSALAELTFLCQFLVANNNEAIDPSLVKASDQPIFTKVAPRVYFVTKVLELQINSFLPFISSDVSQMLIDFYPHRIPKPLRKKIQKIIEAGIQRELTLKNHLKSVSVSNSFPSCVIFQSETDGKANFPNQRDCQDFSKQRDMFYSIKEIWALNQRQARSPASPMPHSQSYDPGLSKIRQLFQLNSGPTNLSRLASLFISQCVLEANFDEPDHDEVSPADENVRRILQTNPSRFEQLRERLSAKNVSSYTAAPNVDPMAFLKYFVGLSNSAAFIQHLIDRLIYEILQIEHAADVEDMSESIEIINQMKKSRILAQMLGYLYFLTYRTDELLMNRKPIAPINVEVYLQSQIALRSYQGFPVDLVEILVTAVRQRRLVFTLPWILEFLSQADPVTFHLSNYKPILTFISCIYRELLVLKPERTRITEFCFENKTFLRFFCGKLFGISTFPDSYLFKRDGKNLEEFLPSSPDLVLPIRDEEDENTNLDSKSFIGLTFMPSWFRTEMKQMRTVLSSSATVKGSVPISSPGVVKHVRLIPEPTYSNSDKSPSETTSEAKSPQSSTADIQRDLEEQFFSIHPASVKKTVDFIAERIASNFVKQLRNQNLLEIKNDLISKMIYSESAVLDCKDQIWKYMDAFSPKKCSETVILLLGDVVSDGVLSVCQAITTRKSNEKIRKWVDQHITKDLFPPQPQPPPTVAAPTAAAAAIAVPVPAYPPGTLFQAMRLLARSIQHLHTGRPIDPTVFDTIATDGQLPHQKSWITERTLDLVLTLITFQPHLLTEELQLKFIQFWKQVPNPSPKKILVPRNLMLFAQSQDYKATWTKLSSLMKHLIRENLASLEELQENCMSLLRQDWPVDVTKCVSEFLKDVLSSVPASGQEVEVMDWIAWYCSARDDEDF